MCIVVTSYIEVYIIIYLYIISSAHLHLSWRATPHLVVFFSLSEERRSARRRDSFLLYRIARRTLRNRSSFISWLDTSFIVQSQPILSI